MRDFSQLRKDLHFRVKSIPLPNVIKFQFVTLVMSWLEASGEEWTIERLKSIKLDIIRVDSGLPPVSSWIARKGNRFKGVFGQLQHIFRKDNMKKHVLHLIQLYTWFYAKGVTPKQWSKFIDGVQANPPPSPAIIQACEILQRAMDIIHCKKVAHLPDAPRLVEFSSSSQRRAPLLGTSVPEIEGVIDSLDYLWMSNAGRSHLRKFEDLYRPVMGGLDWYKLYLQKRTGPYGPMPDLTPDFVVGRIGLIQEPGYKLRAVANPGRVFQTVLQPLGNAVYRTLKALPWDCTFDQDKGFKHMQERLTNGGIVHSIDLSGATDYFPLALQQEVLMSMFPDDHVNLFVDIAKGTWEVPDKGSISWKRGQPLGLYPSFGSFALTHGLLLLGLAGRYDQQFYILGDDVVILDDELAHKYRTLLGVLQCPISESKSISSNKLCEFGGKIITEKSVIPQIKWRQVSDDSFLDIVRNLGRQGVCLLRSRQRNVVEKLASLPESLGGLGWNSAGVDLSTRLASHPWLFEPQEPDSRMTSYTRRSIRTLFSSDSFTLTLSDQTSLVCSLSGDLDQRSIALTSKYLSPSLIPWYQILGKNLDEVLTSKLLECDLPFETCGSSPSALTVWEKKVQ